MKNLKTLQLGKMLHLKTMLLSIILSFFFVTNSQGQVLNGSFEADPIVPLPAPFLAFATYIPGAAMTNWTNTSSTDDLDLHHMTHLAMGSSNLDYHIDLNQSGEATQTGIMLTGGVSYTLSFDVSLHANIFLGFGANAQVELSTGGGPIFTFPISMTKTTASGIAQGWGAPTISLPIPIGTTGVYDLKFSGISSSYGSGGILIDNVSLTAPCPPVSISGSTSICTGDIALLNASPVLAGYTYTWTPGGATGPSLTTGPLTSTTTYTVTMTDPISGCTSTASHTVNVNPLTVPTFSFNTTYCNGAAIPALPTTSDNGITGTWSPALSNTTTQTYTFTPAPGQCAAPYTTTITIDQCCFNVDFCYVVENKKLSFTSVTPTANVTPCTYNFKWIWGDGTSSPVYTSAASAKAATKTYASEGSYTVCLEVRKVCAGVTTCCKSICKTIKTVPKCDATTINAELGISLRPTATGTIVTPVITSPDFKALAGTELTISYGVGSGIPNYVVNTGANTFNVTLARKTYTIPGIYEYCVTLKYMNALGDSCVDKKCKTIVIEPWCATQAYYKLASCAQSNTFTFTPIGNAATTNVSWDFGDGTTAASLGNVPIVKTYTTPGIYQVCMRIQQGKCYSSACYFVNVQTAIISNCPLTSQLMAPNGQNETSLDDIPLNEIIVPFTGDKTDVATMVYPNPAKETINVVLTAPSEKQAKIEIHSLDGKIIYTSIKSVDRENSKETIDSSGFENGIYVVSIEVDGQKNTHKIMVNK